MWDANGLNKNLVSEPLYRNYKKMLFENSVISSQQLFMIKDSYFMNMKSFVYQFRFYSWSVLTSN